MYTHTQYEVSYPNVSLTATGDKAFWSPGFVPHIVRGVAAVITNDIGATARIKFDKRPVAGTDTNRTDGTAGTLNLDTTHVAGKVVYQDNLHLKVFPGEEVVIECDDAGVSGDTATIVIFVEPTWEEPVNNTRMVKTV